MICTDVLLAKCQLLALLFLLTISKQKKEIKQIISVTHHFIDTSANVRVHFVAEYILPLDTFNLYSLSNLPC